MNDLAQQKATGPGRVWKWAKKHPWWLAATVVLTAVFVASVALVIVTALDPTGHVADWAFRTGPLGDTFGGVLGPILNAAVLAATVYLAITWEPRRARKDEHDRTERAIAMKIVAWIAETDEGSHTGVVIANSADSVAHNVDLIALRDRDESARLVDREATVPPGTWFIPFNIDDGAAASDWKLPVSVDTSEQLSVTLRSDQTGDAEVGTVYTLRPHLPQSEGEELLPHYTLKELRFELHGQSWLRDRRGSLIDADSLTDEEDALRETAMRTPRVSAQPRTAPRTVSEDLNKLMRFTVSKLCNTTAEAEVDLFEQAVIRPQKVDQTVLPGVVSISRNGKSTMVLHLAAEGRRVVLFQVNDEYPVGLEVQNSDLEEVMDGKRKLSFRAKKAGAAAIGKQNAGDLPQLSAWWVSTAERQQLWLATLRAIVDVANRPVSPADSQSATRSTTSIKSLEN